MLVLMRLYPKSGMTSLLSAIESEKRNLYWKDVEPLYAVRLEGKKFVSIVMNVKSIEAVQRVFMSNIKTMAAVKRTDTIPLMSPIYFPLPKGHPEDMDRFLAAVKVAPGSYERIYSKVIGLKNSTDTFITYVSFSFGDDDLIISLLSTDKEKAEKYVSKNIGKMDGVIGTDVSRVVNKLSLLPPEKLKAHKDIFLYTKPVGMKGKRANPSAFAKYEKENSPMTVIVRLFADTTTAKVWEDLEKNIDKFETRGMTPLYASLQEAKSHVSVIFDVKNFEVLKDFVVDNLPTLVNVKKTRTVPLLQPTYFLLPKEHPKTLERYLISLQVDPSMYQTVHSNIVGYDFPGNIFMTYLSYSLGEDDILLSVLTESRKDCQGFAKNAFDRMPGVISCNISNQLKTMRLTSKTKWKQHQGKFLSSYDKQHRKDFDTRYDWTVDFHDYALMTGAFKMELED